GDQTEQVLEAAQKLLSEASIKELDVGHGRLYKRNGHLFFHAPHRIFEPSSSRLCSDCNQQWDLFTAEGAPNSFMPVFLQKAFWKTKQAYDRCMTEAMIQ